MDSALTVEVPGDGLFMDVHRNVSGQGVLEGVEGVRNFVTERYRVLLTPFTVSELTFS